MGSRSWTAGIAGIATCAGLMTPAAASLAAGATPSRPNGVNVSSITVGTFPQGIAVDATTNTIYVANQGSDNVSVINGGTDKVTATITLPAKSAPTGVAVDPATDMVYVVEPGTGAVQVIDGQTNKLGASIGLLSPSQAPGAITVDPATDTIFVAVYGGLFKIDGTTNMATADGGIFNTTSGTVAVNQDTGYPYTADPISGAYDLRPGQQGHSLPVNINPISVAAGDRGSDVFFVSNCYPGFYSTVWEFNASNDKLLQQIGAPWLCPRELAVDGSTVFAADGGLAVLSVKGDAVTGAFSGVPADGIAVDEKTGVVYATDGASKVWVVPRQAPVFDSATSVTVAAGGPGSAFWVQTSANPAPTYQETGKLPAGVHLASWGELYLDQEAGTGGRYPITISASNGVGPPAAQAFVVVVTQPPGFASATARTSFQTGRRGTYRIRATGYPDPTITEAGRLPAGLKLVGDEITGTPQARSGGVYRVHLTAANSSGPSASQTLTIVVKQAPLIVSPAKLTCKPGRRCHLAIRADGFPVPSISEAGTLPRGLKFRAGKNGTATISGSVSRRASPMVFHIKLIAASPGGHAQQRVTIRVT